ncbi:MAG: 50S ribosomal protein L6 [Phycisphaerales bacterium]|nr:MAG: 50S ribosomal protein L6 [Phycisphaerales bacterium]
MSRIGKKPITVPKGVKVGIDGQTIRVEGAKGTLTHQVHPLVSVSWDEASQTLSFSVPQGKEGDRQAKSLWGTTRSIVQNHVRGVTEGYSKSLEVQGVGYTAAVEGNRLKLVVGFANPIYKDIPQGVDVKVEKQTITVSGYDKQKVGQFAAEVRAVRKPEPYNGKGIKYSDEVIIRKEGKTAGG